MGLFDWLRRDAATAADHMTTQELLRLIRSGPAPYLVDVREPQELAGPRKALPGAKNIPFSEFPARFREIPRDRSVVLICLSGARSGRAAQFLRSQGYTQVKNVIGGMLTI
jgi:rhodanese-related sulfurtransferase